MIKCCKCNWFGPYRIVDDPSESQLEEADIPPKDCFEVEPAVVQPNQSSTLDLAVTQPKLQHKPVAVNNQFIFTAEKFLKRRKKKG